MHPYLCVLVALLSAASVGLAQAPQTATIAGNLDVVVNEGRFSTSLEFRGQGADNNRFIAEMLSDYLASHFVREDAGGGF